MSDSSKISRHIVRFCTSLFGFSVLVSCAGNPAPTTEPDAQQSSSNASSYYSDDYTADFDGSSLPANGNNSAGISLKNGVIDAPGYRFEPPAGNWSIIGGEDGAPYEFYNAETGRRAVRSPRPTPKRLSASRAHSSTWQASATRRPTRRSGLSPAPAARSTHSRSRPPT